MKISRTSPPAVPVTQAPAAAVAPAAAAPVKAGWSVGATAGVRPAAPSASPVEVANAFFGAFQKQDTATFDKLYAPGATFKDPIYDLQGKGEVVHMWKSLFKAGKDLKMTYQVLESGPDSAKVAWKADYKVFGRPVHNEAVTELKVKDGQIVAQQDSWSWSKWARQALPLGPLVDFPPVKAALRFVMQQA